MMKSIKGEIYVTVCVFVLISAVIFSVVLTYSSVITQVNLLKENTQIVLDSFVTKNSILIFSNIKKGLNATNGVDTESLTTSLKEFCTLEEKNGMLYNVSASGEIENYRITKPKIKHLANLDLEISLTYKMYIPIRFAGKTITEAEIPIEIISELTAKK